MQVLEAHTNAHQERAEVLLQHSSDCGDASQWRDHPGNKRLMQTPG